MAGTTQTARASSSRRPAVPVEVEDEVDIDDELEDGEDLGQWTLDDFQSRPLGGEAAATLINQLRTKLLEPISKLDNTLNQFAKVAAAIADCDERHQALDQVQMEFIKVLNTKRRLQLKIEVLKSLEQRVRGGEQIAEIESVYQEAYEERLVEWKRMSDRAKFKADKQFEMFRTAIWEENHPDDPLPPLTRFLPLAEGEEEDSDDDMEMGGSILNYKCPLSGTTLKDAHTSRLCGHHYSGEYINQQFKGNKPIKCPVAGCSHKLTKNSIYPDPELQKKADEWVKRQAKRARETAQNEYDEEDVVPDD